LLDIYEPVVPAIDDKTPIETLRLPLRTWRKRIAEAYIHDRHALTFDEFYRNGKTWLDLDIWSETQREIGRLYESEKNSVQLILIGCVAGNTSIYLVSHGEVSECLDLAVIGTGYAVAEAAIYWRLSHDSPRNLEQTKYAAYEAKKLSELSPYVGVESTMIIVRPSKDKLTLDFDLVDMAPLEECFKQFGPKPYIEPKASPPQSGYL
jgi:hypothetical protein